MKKLRSLLLPIFLLTGYQMQAQPNGSPANLFTSTAQPAVEVIYRQERLPATGEKLGEIKLKRGHYTFCDIHDLLSLAKAQAAEKGGNAIYVTSIKPPANGRGCFNIEAEIYKLQETYVSTPSPDFPERVSATDQGNGYTYTEIMPEFPGGDRQLLSFIIRNFNYPATALRDNVEGKVTVTFAVRANGKVDDIQIKQGVRWDLDQEIIRIIESMPEWVPGYQNGKAVDVIYTVPVNLTHPQRKNKTAR